MDQPIRSSKPPNQPTPFRVEWSCHKQIPANGEEERLSGSQVLDYVERLLDEPTPSNALLAVEHRDGSCMQVVLALDCSGTFCMTYTFPGDAMAKHINFVPMDLVRELFRCYTRDTTFPATVVNWLELRESAG